MQVDVRLVTATNQDLPQLIAQGRFRRDLYDRLAVLEINLPPLRERGGDIVLLARHFAQETAWRHGRELPVQFAKGALRRLEGYGWPGNVRELKNVVTRAVLLSTSGVIREYDLCFTLQPLKVGGSTRPPANADSPARPSRGRLEELLDEEGGNISALSRRLRVCTKTIYRWLRSERIDLMSFRGVTEACIVALAFGGG